MINKVTLVGHLGKSPETKYFPTGGSSTTFTLATSVHWVDKSTGEKKEKTEWHRIVAYNKIGENAQQFLNKGDLVYVEGSLQTRTYQDATGVERYIVEIVANTIRYLRNAKSSSNPVAKEESIGYSNDFNTDDVPF